MRKIISFFLITALCLSSLFTFAYAQEVAYDYTDDEISFIHSKYIGEERMLDALFGNSDTLTYWSMIEKTKNDDVLSWSIDAASKIIGVYPDRQDYAEILANLMTMQCGDIAEQVQNQSQFDDLKNGMDYAMDIIGIATSFVGGANLLESISPIIDAATGGTEVTIANVEQAKYYETTIRDYSQSKMFLEAVSMYADNEELSSVATSLLAANDKLLEKRLEYLADSTSALVDYEAEFFVENLSFALLKTAELYQSNETVKWYVDCGEKLCDTIGTLFSIGEFTFRGVMLIGDIGFGTTDTFNRYQEMKIISDVASAIVEANNQIRIPREAEGDMVLADVRTKCDYYKMLIMSHARGEYLAYQLLTNDAGLISDFRVLFDYFKAPEDTTDSWYRKVTSYFVEHYNILNKMFVLPDVDVPHGLYNTENIPLDAVEFNGHYYYLYDFSGLASDDQNTWEHALAYCQGVNGYLATITSSEENEFVFNYMKEHGYDSAYFGLTDSDSEDDWVWCNGEAVDYTNWASREPSGGTSENYAMFYYKYSDGTWNDGDFKDSTTNNGGMAFICEWGEYEVTSESKTEGSNKTTSDERDIVLVLDVSGSMSGTPIEETKKASVNFIDTILEEDASIGIVTYDNSANCASDFSVKKTSLENTVSGIYDGGGTNIEAGLREAHSMLSSSNAKKKIIVLMSDGEPNEGKEGDDLVAYADEIKKDGVLIYTLGFFESLGGYKSSAQQLMERIASDGCHYEVANADDLVFFFEDMADQINGQKYIYVRIACPVDVSVTYEGETLSSAEKDLNFRTDFGTLTFEQDEEDLANGIDDRVKVLRLKEGTDYDLKIVGTGHGIMDYTIGFMDDNGDYSDLRRFENVKITKRTVIDTEAAVSKQSTLNIDEDGDGKYDVRLRAGENGYGEEIVQSWFAYFAVGGCGLLCLLLVVIIVRKVQKRRKRR